MNQQRRTTSPWTVLAMTGAVVLVLLRVAHAHHVAPRSSGAAAAHAASASRNQHVAMQVVRVGRGSIRVPRTWRRVEGGTDHATWAAADRSASVTLGVVPAAAAPLAEVVTGSVAELRRTLPGLRSVRTSAASTAAATVRFAVVRHASRIEVLQDWHRDEGANVDVVATWSWAAGTSPPRRARARVT